MEEVNRKMAAGAFWMLLFKLVDRGIGLVSTIILARLLIPADFGLVALASTIIGVLELLGAFNFDLALIQNQNAGREHLDTAWTFDVIMGCVYALLLCALAFPAAQFYSDSRLEAIMYWLAIGQIMIGLSNIGIVEFRKELDFKLEFRLLFIKRVIGFVVTVALAMALRSYWALVAGTLVSRFSGMVITYLLHPYRPRFCLSKRHELFHFSKWLLVNNVLFFITNKFSNFVIGKMVGMHALGIFTVSYELANLPSTELVIPINRVLFPGFSRLSGDKSLLRKSYLEVTGVLALFAFPIGMGLIVIAKPLVLAILGEKWIEAVPLFQLLAINGAINAIGGNLSPACIAMGKPRILTVSTLLYVFLLIPSMIVGAKLHGLLGSVIGMVVAHLVMTPVGWFMVLSQMEVKFTDLFFEIWRSFIASIIMGLIVYWVQDYMRIHEMASMYYWQLFVSVFSGMVVYVLALLMILRLQGLPNGSETKVFAFVMRTLRVKMNYR